MIIFLLNFFYIYFKIKYHIMILYQIILNLLLEMKLEIKKIQVSKQCFFNTLKLAVVVEKKHVQFQTISFKDGKEEQDDMVIYKPKPRRFTLKGKPQNIILIVNPSILNLKTPFESVYLNQSLNEVIVVQTELGQFTIEYSLQFFEETTPTTTARINNNGNSEVEWIPEFHYKNDQPDQCQVCNRSQSDKRIKQYRPSIQEVIKQNVELKHQLNLLRSEKLVQTKTLMKDIQRIEEQSKGLAIQNIRKKRSQLEMKNMIEDERIQMMKKILHMRDLLDSVKKI